jgi:hypothetical protein
MAEFGGVNDVKIEKAVRETLFVIHAQETILC